jgi:phosphinothricin acetyltransferase
MTVYVHEDFRRRRVGYALYTALLGLLPLQGFVMAHAGITLPNAGSVGLHEAVGFRQVALYQNVGYKLGRWHDVGWWQRGLRSPELDPSNPLTVEESQAMPEWLETVRRGQELLTI